MAEPLRTGVIGTGSWGTHIAEQFHENPDAEVVSIADVTERNRAKAGETLAVEPDHRYGNHQAMLENEALDAVQISSPHAFHHEHILAAFDHGCHVFCEKPLTIGVDAARDLLERAETGDRTLMVGYQRHVHPAYVAARGAISAGDLEAKLVTAELTQGWLEKVVGTWRVDHDLSGGGQLYDSGSHLVDAVCWIVGQEPTYVTAEMAFPQAHPRIDVQAALTIRFDGGTVASVTVSGDAPAVEERLCVRGGGTALIEGTGWRRREGVVLDADGAQRRRDAGDLSSYDKVDAFVRAVQEGAAPPATARDAFYATAVTEAAYESVRTGERVAVARPDPVGDEGDGPDGTGTGDR